MFVCYPSTSRVFDRSWEDKWEGAMVKHLCQENYQAAANTILKFPPFCIELVKAITCQVKKELETYSKGKSMAKYDGNPLSLKTVKSEDLLEEARNAYHACHCDRDEQSPGEILHK